MNTDEMTLGDKAIVLRGYRPSDHEAVVALWEQAGFRLGPDDGAKMLARKAAEPGPFLVAELDGKLTGTVMGHVDRGWGWVNRLAVHPDHRRRGLGRRLLEAAEQALAVMGARRSALLTHCENAAALGLYERAGYTRYDQIVFLSKPLVAEDDVACCGCASDADCGRGDLA